MEARRTIETQNFKNMYSRSDSMTLTVQQESFAFSRMATRSTEPEVFTFERIPAQATAVRSYVPIRPRKRCTRVMYPAKVRMHLPPPEKNRAKRWLVVLCLVVLWQIYTAEPCADAASGGADSPVGDCHGLPSLSAQEEQARQLADLSDSSELLSGSPISREDDGSSSPQIDPNNAGEEAESSRALKQSAGKSYMVALLVYHRLGSDS